MLFGTAEDANGGNNMHLDSAVGTHLWKYARVEVAVIDFGALNRARRTWGQPAEASGVAVSGADWTDVVGVPTMDLIIDAWGCIRRK